VKLLLLAFKGPFDSRSSSIHYTDIPLFSLVAGHGQRI